MDELVGLIANPPTPCRIGKRPPALENRPAIKGTGRRAADPPTVRHKCGTSAAQVRHKFGTSSEQVRGGGGGGGSAEHSADRVRNADEKKRQKSRNGDGRCKGGGMRPRGNPSTIALE